MNYVKILFLAVLIPLSGSLKATPDPDEGMWLPLLLKDYNYEEMKRLGCTLTPEQIYSVNNASLKDAIVQLGGFCTAEVISDEGLLLTNHHCAFDAIQDHSTTEHDYIKDGFWAKDKAAELPVEGLTVSFLVRMEDVSKKVLDKAADYQGQERDMAIQEMVAELEEGATEDGKYRVEVKSMFEGNAYYLFVYQVYRDVRLVGAPPSAVGKFGGDTDNWMWPRHTGDFSMLRIYAGGDNQPADYSAANKPFKPKHHLPVSMTGTKKGDYTMIMGYPGSTDRYLTSFELKTHKEVEAPLVVDILKKRLDIMKADMAADRSQFIAMSSGYNSLSNTQKYYEGQLLGMNKFDLVADAEAEEMKFLKWVNADAKRKEKFGGVLGNIEEELKKRNDGIKASSYYNMAGFGPDMVINGIGVWRLSMKMDMLEKGQKVSDDDIAPLKEGLDDMFKEYFAHTDQKIFALTTQILYENLPADQKMSVFESATFKKVAKGTTNEEKFAAYAAYVYKKSVLTDKARMAKFLNKPNKKKLDKDPGLIYIKSLIASYRVNMGGMGAHEGILGENRRLLLEGMMEANPALKKSYPDANFTMRVTYGSTKPYSSWDGKPYNTFTYASEILDKYVAGDPEFDVPEKLRTLIKNKDYGDYAVDGVLPVCFLHNTDITGGNSGSPVINGKGELVGVAFDGNWESMISDLNFDETFVRTISVDIRYVLFIIDKYADAKHLIEEMDVVR